MSSMYENDRSQSPVDDMMKQEQSQRSVSRSRSRSPVRRSRSRSRSRSPRRDERHRDRARKINLISKRIIISNIPYEMKWQDIKDIFRKEVGDVTYVELFENTQGKSKGQGVIEFKDKDTARKAIETMHRYKIKDRNIVVREERESDRGMLGRGVMGSGPASGMMGGMMGNMGGGGGAISPQVLSQLGIEGPVTNQVFVSNLDYKVTWKKLKDVFRLAGNVTRAEIKEDKDGKSRGMGTVTFETQFEAVQAVSMFNGQTLYDRQLRVKMDSMGVSDKSSSLSLPSGLKSIGAGLGPGGTPLQGSGGMGMGSGMGGGMGGSMGSSMGNMGMGMDSGMGMGNMGMSNMGSGMGGSGNMGMGMNNMGSSNFGSSGMSGMSNMGSSSMGMGNMSGMSDNYSGMNNSYNTSGYSSNMSGGMGDSMRGMGSGMSSNSMSAYSTGIADLGSSMGGSSGYGSSSGRSSGYGMSSSYTTSSGRSRSSDRDGGSRSTRPDNCTVVVKNLPWKVTWQDLKEKFRSVADVKFAEIKMENGKSQGWGLVRFGSADDAQQAISMMNRTRIDGREIDVKLYR